MTVIFHGDAAEARALEQVIADNCTCRRDPLGRRSGDPCSSCRMFVSDQRALDGLVMVARWRDRLLAEEWSD